MLTHKHTRILIFFGLLTLGATQLSGLYLDMSELTYGALHGLGLGLLLVGLYAIHLANRRLATSN